MKTLLAAITIFLGACSASADLSSHAGLAARVQDYYMHEKKGEWEKAYRMRTPAFRKTVPLRTYLSTMKEDNAGWQLKDFKVLSAEKKDDKVHVNMEFTEEGPANSFPPELSTRGDPQSRTDRVRLQIKGTSVWIEIDNEWYVQDAVSRTHLSLNNPITAE